MIGTSKLCAHFFPPFFGFPKCFKFLEQLLLSTIFLPAMVVLTQVSHSKHVWDIRINCNTQKVTQLCLYLQGRQFQVVCTKMWRLYIWKIVWYYLWYTSILFEIIHLGIIYSHECMLYKTMEVVLLIFHEWPQLFY